MDASQSRGAGNRPASRARAGGVKPHVRWLDTPEQQHVDAARSYLSMLASPRRVGDLMAELAVATTVSFKAKDVLRACGLAPVAARDPHVAKDLARINHGEPLSPLLMVRGDVDAGRPATLADGYHRVSAAWHVDPDTDVACLLAGAGGIS
jgi:hypothetical protein